MISKFNSLIGALVVAWSVLILPQSCPAAGESLYDVRIPLVDQEGVAFELGDMRGQDVIIAMAYTSCESACPITMQRLKKLETQLKKQNKKVQFLIVTLDPEHDTPKKLHGYLQSYKLAKDRWRLATGESEDVRKLSLLLGISYGKSNSSDEIMHSNKIVLLDREGVVKAEVEGLAGETDSLADAAS